MQLSHLLIGRSEFNTLAQYTHACVRQPALGYYTYLAGYTHLCSAPRRTTLSYLTCRKCAGEAALKATGGVLTTYKKLLEAEPR